MCPFRSRFVSFRFSPADLGNATYSAYPFPPTTLTDPIASVQKYSSTFASSLPSSSSSLFPSFSSASASSSPYSLSPQTKLKKDVRKDKDKKKLKKKQSMWRQVKRDYNESPKYMQREGREEERKIRSVKKDSRGRSEKGRGEQPGGERAISYLLAFFLFS